MAKPIELNQKATKAYNDGKFQEAALVWLQAAEAAKTVQDLVNWYKYTVWAAESFNLADNHIKALDLLMDAKLYEPPLRPDFEAWIVQTNLIEISLKSHPLAQNIQNLLNELKNLEKTSVVAKADIHYLEGQFSYKKGQWKAALVCYEQAWLTHHGTGYAKYTFAIRASDCCLKLNQLPQVSDWLNASQQTQDKLQGRLFKEARIKLQLALAKQTDFNILKGLLRDLDDLTASIQAKSTEDSLNELTVRVMLLKPAQDNPLLAQHPAKQALLRPLFNVKNVHAQYERRLLVLDFRLATLRFCVGISALDDLYYTQPPSFKDAKKPKIKDFKKCQQRVLNSCQQAAQYAKKIDDLLACDYRQKEVAQRKQRIMEVVNWVDY